MVKYQDFIPFIYFKNNMESLFQDDNIEFLYHYTDANAFKSIIKTNRIWFSDIHYMNDKSELQHTYDTLFEILKEDNPYDENFKKDMQSYINSHIYHRPFKITRLPRQNIFIASFSQAADELSLWNYYTKSDKKFGYNIGFKTEEFTKNKDKKYFCGKVIYDIYEQESQIKKALKEYQKLYLEMDDPDEKYEVIGLFMDFITLVALFYKHKSFSTEQEYRLIYIQQEKNPVLPVEYRVHNGIFIPYIEVGYSTESIKKITASPLVNINLCEGVNQFLRSYNVHATVTPSQIPIRY